MAFTENGIVIIASVQQWERISLIFELLEEMDKENEKRVENQSRKRVGIKRADEQ